MMPLISKIQFQVQKMPKHHKNTVKLQLSIGIIKEFMLSWLFHSKTEFNVNNTQFWVHTVSEIFDP